MNAVLDRAESAAKQPRVGERYRDTHGLTWSVVAMRGRRIEIRAGGLTRVLAPERLADWTRQ